MKKRILSLLLISALALTLAACSGKPKEGAYTPGTYEGKAQGYGGAVVVSVTVDEAGITGATITGDQETPSVGGAALEELTAQVKEKGAEIDGVAGATVTSNAVKEAAGAALDQAKA